jgi:hypothetical protein
MDAQLQSLLLLILINVIFLVITFILFGILRVWRGDKQKVKLTKQQMKKYWKIDIEEDLEQDLHTLLLDPSQSNIIPITIINIRVSENCESQKRNLS